MKVGGHPLASRCQEWVLYPGGASHHCFVFSALPHVLSRPFLHFMAATESRQTLIWIKQLALICHRPDGIAAPEERWCRAVSNWLITLRRGWRLSGTNSCLAHVAGDSRYGANGDGQRHRFFVQPVLSQTACLEWFIRR